MSNTGAASLAALSPARAAASRRNGAKSRGPKTPEGKARSALNALKHGLCAGKAVVIGDEDWDMFDELEAALIEEMAPQSPMQAVLARRIVLATWRLERVERMEAELLAHNMRDTASFGLGLSRDCNGPRAFNTLLRYRNSALAEFWRCRSTLEALQAKAAQEQAGAEEAAAKQAAAAVPRETVVPAVPEALGEGEAQRRIEPEPRGIPDPSASADAPTGGVTGPDPCPALTPVAAPVATSWSAPARPAPAPAPAPAAQRIEPERSANPGEPAPFMVREMVTSAAALLAAVPAQPGRRR
jgi:hypothetical protein